VTGGVNSSQALANRGKQRETFHVGFRWLAAEDCRGEFLEIRLEGPERMSLVAAHERTRAVSAWSAQLVI